MSTNTNQLMTAGAVAFAGFALWYVMKPASAAAPVAVQPGQAARDAGLQKWLDSFFTEKWYERGAADYANFTVPMTGALLPGMSPFGFKPS